jgi:hypothetical protein
MNEALLLNLKSLFFEDSDIVIVKNERELMKSMFTYSANVQGVEVDITPCGKEIRCLVKG